MKRATISDIPIGRFEEIRAQLESDGWVKYYEYEGFDAWIDYGCLKLKHGSTRLKMEWDNWTEGSLEGHRDLIEQLGRQFGLPVNDKWRWSDYDQAPHSRSKDNNRM